MQSQTRKILYGALVLLCVTFSAFILAKGKDKVAYPVLKERTGALANDPEWLKTKKSVETLYSTLDKKPNDTKTMLLLVKEFMQEARATGNFSYYNKAALSLTDMVLAKEPQNIDALCFKSMIFLSLHRFAEGKEVATQALKLNPHYSFVYGLMVDANVELGDYDEAVKMADQMNGVRPDLRSYSRVSYLREIYGDAPGAIDAANMAVGAGFPGTEETEWTRMVLAHLYEDTNQLDKAMEQYQIALSERPNYPFALAGMGKLARYRKDYPAAIKYFESARDIISDASFFEELIDLYRLNNEPEKAKQCAQITLDALLADNISANKDKNMGHYSDRELANIYLSLGEMDKALEHAKAEYERRPQNIDAAETFAWVLYKQGKASEAAPMAETALRTKAQKPERLVKMGLVLKANGNKTGADLIAKGLALKPYMNEKLVKAAQE